MAFCFAHATVEATGTCDDCKKPICTKCTKGTLDGFMCPPCAQKRYGRQKLIVWAKIGAITVLIVGLGVFGLIVVGKGSERSTKAVDAGTGEKDPYIQTLRETRDLAPCDKEAVRKLVLELMELKRYGDAVDDATAYFAKCEDFPRLRSNAIYALHQLGRYAEAIKHSTALVERDPFDSDYWWWRAEDLARTGEPAKALADYRQSIANSDGAGGSRFAIARILDTAGPAGQPCEAVAAIDFFAGYHGGNPSSDLITRTRGLDQTSSCARTKGQGKQALPPPTEDVQMTVKVNEVEGTFLIETRCGTTIVTPAFAQLAAITPRQGPPIETIAVGAIRKGAPAVATLVLGKATAPETELVIAEGLPPGVDGVIGLSALWKFSLVVDEDSGVMTLDGPAPAAQ
ncbi:MAG: aspartyl protease family protein [Deltaproteobacteria bacterium]|nr:aspartyl protease family protein [Kofleriaceae bacterium]